MLTFIYSLQSYCTSITMDQVLFCSRYFLLVALSLFQEELTFVFKSHQFRLVHISTHTRLEVCNLFVCPHHILSCVSVSVHLYYYVISIIPIAEKKKEKTKETKNFKVVKGQKSSTTRIFVASLRNESCISTDLFL